MLGVCVFYRLSFHICNPHLIIVINNNMDLYLFRQRECLHKTQFDQIYFWLNSQERNTIFCVKHRESYIFLRRHLVRWLIQWNMKMCKQSLHVMMEHANLFFAGDMNLYNFARILWESSWIKRNNNYSYIVIK